MLLHRGTPAQTGGTPGPAAFDNSAWLAAGVSQGLPQDGRGSPGKNRTPRGPVQFFVKASPICNPIFMCHFFMCQFCMCQWADFSSAIFFYYVSYSPEKSDCARKLDKPKKWTEKLDKEIGLPILGPEIGPEPWEVQCPRKSDFLPGPIRQSAGGPGPTSRERATLPNLGALRLPMYASKPHRQCS